MSSKIHIFMVIIPQVLLSLCCKNLKINYKVLAVGKVVDVDAHISVPEKHVPVFVASSEECASAILAPGNVVFWPTDLLAVY